MDNVIAFPARLRPSTRQPLLRREPVKDRRPTKPTNQPTLPGHSGWAWPAFTEFLPNGLPMGALTLIKVRAFAPGVMHQVVGDLIRSTTEARRSCIYTLVNGSPHYPRVTDQAGARIVHDQDIQASVVDTQRGVRHWYECGVPTLNVVPPRVAEIEQATGPALLVLDGIQDARPYNHDLVGFEIRRFGDSVVLNRTGLNQWRAADLLTYSKMRPHAPTVLVWHAPLERENTDGYRRLLDASHVVIDGCDLREGPQLLISARDSLDEPLPFQAAAW